jgi:hypothetical protein
MELVDAIIPRTPELAQLYGSVMYYGALDLLTDEYITMNLKYLMVPISELKADKQMGSEFFTTEGLAITSSLNRYTMMGFYSEWFGYGTTRLNPPNERKLEFDPISWEQIGYPGPSFSYINEIKQYYALKHTNTK